MHHLDMQKSRSREQKKELHQELIQVQQQLGEEQRRRKSHQISAEQKVGSWCQGIAAYCVAAIH